jgi:ferredoxin/NAD(P)H-dependent FMN reductase
LGDQSTCAVVYMSPQGTTKKAAGTIAALLSGKGFEVEEFNLAGLGSEKIEELVGEAAGKDVLVVGSPVYSHHPLAPVMAFIEALPRAEGKPSLVFGNFGGVTKGMALYEMGALLASRGYRVKGAAQVLSQHSMMFREDEPLGKGHPDQGDWEVLAEWIDEVGPRLSPENNDELDIETVAKDSPVYRAIAMNVMDVRYVSKVLPHVHFDPSKCKECGACVKRCPAARLEVIPQRRRSEDCLHCYECVQVCREGAMDAPMYLGAPMIRLLGRMENRREAQVTEYYL